MPAISTVLNDAHLLLDTHIWLWLAAGQIHRFTRPFLDRLKNQRRDASIYISAATAWEVAMLVRKGSLKLNQPLETWFNAALERGNTKVLSLDYRVALRSIDLPGLIHGDPLDRILVETAMYHDLILVTCDHVLLDYSKVAERFFAYYPKKTVRTKEPDSIANLLN